MTDHFCPHCHSVNGRWLDEMGLDESFFVNYYRCAACAHIWGVPKHNPRAPSSDITLHYQNLTALGNGSHQSPSRVTLFLKTVGDWLAMRLVHQTTS